MRNQALRVVIADDHPFYRDGLIQMLRQSGIDVIAGVPNAEAAIQAVEEAGPDVVVMDLNMPGLSGLEATRRLSEQAPTSPVVVLTVSAQEEDVAEAMLAGASGYVLKDWPAEDIVAGIRTAAAGRSLLTAPIAAILLRRVAERGAVLSERELAVLERLSEGRSHAAIADDLGVDPNTVRADVETILIKLQVESRIREQD